MLISYYSNHLEQLASHLIEVIQQSPPSPFIPETIIVQSNGMARWLSLQLAEQLGICAHVRFPFPGTLLWETIRGVLNEVPIISAFEPPILTLRIMAVLQTHGASLAQHPDAIELHDYLAITDKVGSPSHLLPAGGGGKGALHGDRSYQLAQRLAELFTSYQIYRPDWIKRWEAGMDTHWQAQLWRYLTATNTIHRVNVQQRFMNAFDPKALDPVTIQRAGLPQRLFIMGISALPPVYIELFAALSHVLDVHLLILNPCAVYWGDIVAQRDIARRGVDVEPDALYLEVGHPLLASLGKQGRDFIDAIQDYTAHTVESFVEPTQNTLLGHLQADLLHLRWRKPAATEATAVSEDTLPQGISPLDRSIQLHVCHSALREVEVLHDQLLALFDSYPDLHPADILVMTPDIESYGPLIEAVFTTVPEERAIPFSIADHGLAAQCPVIEAFFSLLELPESRLDANQLIALLDIPAIQRRFDLTADDLPLIRRWIEASGIRWGIDEQHRADLGLPAMREHSWQAGLDRLLLGYALPSCNQKLFAGILPYDDVEGGDAAALGGLHDVAQAVFEWMKAGTQQYSIAQWVNQIHELLDTFFDPREEDNVPLSTSPRWGKAGGGHVEALQQVRMALATLLQAAEQASFDEPVSLRVMQLALRQQLTQPESDVGRFIAGGVTFCTFVPMRSLPFQVIGMLGMGHDAYPRPAPPMSFDLMQQQFRRGDRARRLDDRYLFLEALISARKVLYISYVGRDRRDNTVIPPSVLVSELMDYLTQGFYCTDGTAIASHLVTEHPLQPFSRRYFCGEKNLFSYAEEWVEASQVAGRGRRQSEPFIAQPLSSPDATWRIVDLEQLIDFYMNPARYLLRQRLGIELAEGEELLEICEPFVLNSFDRYQLHQEMLRLQRIGVVDAAAEVLRGQGLLPHGQVGQQVFQREQIEVEHFAERLAEVLPKDHHAPVAVDVHLGDWRLVGWLTNLSEHGLIGYRMTTIKGTDRLRAWIRHLVLHLADPKGVARRSHWLGTDGDWVALPVPDASAQLLQLLDYYWQGLHRPLPFFPASAWSYAFEWHRAQNAQPDQASPTTSRTLKKPKTVAMTLADIEQRAQKAAYSTWQGSRYEAPRVPPENRDPYYQLAFRGLEPMGLEFNRLALAIYLPLLEYSYFEGLQEG